MHPGTEPIAVTRSHGTRGTPLRARWAKRSRLNSAFATSERWSQPEQLSGRIYWDWAHFHPPLTHGVAAPIASMGSIPIACKHSQRICDIRPPRGDRNGTSLPFNPKDCDSGDFRVGKPAFENSSHQRRASVSLMPKRNLPGVCLRASTSSHVSSSPEGPRTMPSP